MPEDAFENARCYWLSKPKKDIIRITARKDSLQGIISKIKIATFALWFSAKIMLPFAILYGAKAIRNFLYDRGILKSHSFDIP